MNLRWIATKNVVYIIYHFFDCYRWQMWRTTSFDREL